MKELGVREFRQYLYDALNCFSSRNSVQIYWELGLFNVFCLRGLQAADEIHRTMDPILLCPRGAFLNTKGRGIYRYERIACLWFGTGGYCQVRIILRHRVAPFFFSFNRRRLDLTAPVCKQGKGSVGTDWETSRRQQQEAGVSLRPSSP